jgi:hypothetical protein
MIEEPYPEGPEEIPPEHIYPPVPQVPVLVRDLPLPPEVAARLDAYCKKARIRRASERQVLEEEYKIQYHFDGLSVANLRTPEGAKIISAGDVESEEFWRPLEALSREERCRTLVYTPHPRDPRISWI